MAVRVDVLIVLRNSLAPVRTAFKFDVIDVDTSVNDIDVDALATARVVLVLGERAEGQLRAMAYPRETLMVESIPGQTRS